MWGGGVGMNEWGAKGSWGAAHARAHAPPPPPLPCLYISPASHSECTSSTPTTNTAAQKVVRARRSYIQLGAGMPTVRIG